MRNRLQGVDVSDVEVGLERRLVQRQPPHAFVQLALAIEQIEECPSQLHEGSNGAGHCSRPRDLHLDDEVDRRRGCNATNDIGLEQHGVTRLRIKRIKLASLPADLNWLSHVDRASDDTEVDLHALELQEYIREEVKVNHESLPRDINLPQRRVTVRI